VAGITDDGTVLIEAGSGGRWVARADLVYDRASSSVISATAEIITVFADDIEANAEVASLLGKYRSELAPILDEVIGTAAVELSTARDECPMGNLLSDVQRIAAEVDFAFQNPGGMRAPIAVGPIKFSDMYRVMPFDDTIVTMHLSGEEVKTLLEEAVGDGSFLHVSGLRYVVDYELPVGERLTGITLADGGTLEPAATYSVAVNNFMAQGGDYLPVVTHRDGAVDTGILVRDALADWIRAETAAGKAIAPQIEGRIDRGS
jgi:2',3'-cyclic-nucleotide 2'-phosphodiesterase (5'-nucleotidase family)